MFKKTLTKRKLQQHTWNPGASEYLNAAECKGQANFLMLLTPLNSISLHYYSVTDTKIPNIADKCIVAW